MTTPNTIIADMQAEIDALRKERDELLYTLETLVTKCDGEEGMRVDLSNIDTSHANALIAKLTPC
jgi:hypothetical protein